jgi:NAD(P) transhydrogenase subunit alpha
VKVAVPRETAPGETRVALTPDVVRREADDHEVRIEASAGEAATFADGAYRDAGAEVIGDAARLLGDADAVLKVGPPRARDDGADEAGLIAEGAVLVGLLDPHGSRDLFRRLADRGVTALSLELLPRITRAQSMDALSSMATVAGYKAALLAADSLVKFFPMLTTAAGTIRPAKVLVLGAGVAGLQAIATARRLGARVEAFDIRPEVKEQVESLGATFVEWEDEDEDVATEDGYATEVSEETEARERELIGRHAAEADVVITTAQVPGGKAPTLVTAEMVEDMDAGSVIVDLAGASGGNCEVAEPGRTREHAGVTVHSPLNLPAAVPLHASQMFARNVTSLLNHVTDEEGRPTIDLDDEIVDAVCVVHGGEVRWEP